MATVKGIIRNNLGAVVVGASVQIKGSQKICTSNENGHYELLDVSEGIRTLVFSALHHDSVELEIILGSGHGRTYEVNMNLVNIDTPLRTTHEDIETIDEQKQPKKTLFGIKSIFKNPFKH